MANDAEVQLAVDQAMKDQKKQKRKKKLIIFGVILAVIVVIVVVAMFLGVDPSSILGHQNQAPQSSQGSSAYDLSKCKTGADAN